MTKKQIEKEIEAIREVNEIMKAAARMVGFDVDKETEVATERLDRRVKVNMYQQARIRALESVLEG